MTNPPGSPHGDPSPWARPAGQEPPTQPTERGAGRRNPPPAPSQSPTREIPAGRRGREATTDPITPPPAGPPPGWADHRPAPPVGTAPGPPDYPPAPPAGTAPGPPDYPPAPPITPPPGSQDTTAPVHTRHHPPHFLRDPLALVLVAITVVALTLAGLIGAELYARHIADGKVARATECVVDDQVSVSFGVSPPFLWQHITGDYTNISIQTAGNRIKDAKEMKADLKISDVRLHANGDSSGSIGALDATITWPSQGIKETVQAMIPLLGNLVSDVSTNPADGTVELKGAFGLASVTVKPQVVNGGLSLQLQSLTGLGSMALPKEAIQPALDEFSTQLTKKYPLGIRADSVQVTDTGVVARFSTRNAAIPAHSQDPCFAHL